jgi:hypothetical protein
MTTSIEVIESRILSLKKLNVTSGNSSTLKLLIAYLENVQSEINSGENSDKIVVLENERKNLEDGLEKLVLLPLPW